MPGPLPDIDLGSWADFQKSELQRQIEEKLGGFGLGRAIEERIGGSQEVVGQASFEPPPEPEPPPLPPPPPAEPEPAPVADYQPPPELYQGPAPETAPVASRQPRAAPVADSTPPTTQPSEADPFTAWRQQVFASGLNAVEQAGGNVQAFAGAVSQGLRGAADRGGATAAALNAAEAAGADVGAFMSTFRPPPMPEPPSPVPSGGRTAAQAPGGDLRAYARQAAERAGVDPNIFEAQIQQESGFNPKARNPSGATGIAQIMPFHKVDATDPYASLDYAANLMSGHLKTYGGDYARALAAYNAGPGAVQKYGGVPPFEETQRYVKTIMGGIGEGVQAVKRAVTGGGYQDISQFGDSQLTSDEAYAACGPAAAVRFAQRFGRNPSLKEALDLAKTVGWTSGQGMAGIASQQKLMQKMGVETELVPGAQWGRFAAEAQTGNPVTISTSAHYFYADGYDPNTGAFHVGRSGTDLRGGKEWMTQQEIESAAQRLGGGAVQGALMADNPTVPGGSTAEAGSPNLLDRFGQFAGGAVDAISGAANATQKRIEQALSEMEEGRARVGRDLESRMEDLNRRERSITRPLEDLGSALQEPGRRLRSALGEDEGPSDYGNLGPSTAPGAEYAPVREAVRRQWAGEEDAQLGPLTIPGRVAAPFGAAQEILGELSGFRQGSRLYEGYAGDIRRDPTMVAALEAQFATDDPAEKMRQQQIMDARSAELRAQGPGSLGEAYQRGFRSPDRENVEMVADVIGGVAATGLAPKGLASGAGRFLGSLALDPTGAPFSAVGEAVAPVGRALGRVFGRGAPQAGDAAGLVDPSALEAGRGVATSERAAVSQAMQAREAESGTLTDNISGRVFNRVDEARRRAPTAEELADAQRTIDEAPGSSPLNPFVEAQTPEGLAGIRRQLRALADEGADQRDWYTDSSRAILEATQGNRTDAEKIAQLVAIYSNNTPVNENMNNAMMAWTQFKRGAKIDAPTLEDNNVRARRLLEDGQDWVGAKTNNFYRNLMKNIDPVKHTQMGRELGETGVTVDIWMMRAMNALPGRKAPSPRTGQYEFASREVERIAKERGWTPEQAQAAIWVAAKAGWENATRKVPMPLSREGTFHYGTALRNRQALTGLESVGGATDELANELGLLTSDGRISLPKARATRDDEWLVDAAGNRTAAAEGAVDDASRRAMNAYVAARGVQEQHPEVYWAREIGKARNLDVANGTVVNAGRALDADEVTQLQGLLDELAPGAARVVPSDTGAWVLHQSDAPSKAIQTATKRALQGLQLSGVERVQEAARRFDSEFFKNDWSTQPNGEGYLDSVRLAGGGLAERISATGGGLGRAGGDAGPGAGRGVDYGAEGIRAPDLPAAGASLLERAAAPLRTSVGRGAVQGAVAGGYEAAQDEGATPQDVALGALGGSVLGAGRGALGRRAGIRAVGQVARIAEEVSPQRSERADRAAGRLEQMARDEFRAGRIDKQEYDDYFEDAKLLRTGAQASDVAPVASAAARQVDNTRAAESVEEAIEDAATKTTPPLDDDGRLNPRPSTAEQMLDVVGARVGLTPGGERVFQHAIPGFGAPGSEVMTEVTEEVARRLPNLAKLAPENSEVRDVLIANAASISPEQIDMYKRGTIHWDELVNDLAGRFGLTKEQYMATEVGQAYNEAEMLALRATVVNEARKEADMMLEFGKKGVANLTDAEKMEGITQILNTGELQAIGTGAASTLGRALNQQKIVMGQEMARTITGQIEQRQAAKLARESKTRADAAARKADDLEKKIAAKKAEVDERFGARQEAKEQTELQRAAKKAFTDKEKAAEAAARQKAAQQIKDWQEALKAARSDENLHRRAQEVADKRAAREAVRAEKVHEHLMGRAREGLKALNKDGKPISDQLLSDYIKLHQNKDPLAIGKFLKGLGNPGWWDRTNIIRYAGMLSSTFTHGTQALSNLIQLGLLPATHGFAVGADIAASALTGGERTRYMGELPQMMRGISAGYKEGLAEAAEVMKSGINVRSMNQDLENITKTGKSGLNQMDFGFEKTAIGKLIGKRASHGVNVAAEFPLRAMQASDLIFRGAARGMHTRQLAARKAIAEAGGKPPTRWSVSERVDEIMANLTDPEHLPLVEEADKLAKRAVLQEESWVSALRSAPTPVRVGLSLAMPFVRTPYNIAAQGLGMTPAGFASAVAAARRGERGEAVDRVARASLGTAVMAGAFLLLSDEHLTAGYPEDDAERSTKPPGWRPWSFRVLKPDGEAVYVPIAFLGPIAIPMALAAVAAEAQAQGKPADKMAIQAVGSIGRFMADQAMLQGFNNAINATIQPGRHGEAYLESLVRQPVPYSGLQRQIGQILDMPSRDPENMFEALLAANLPTMDRVAPRLDPLGREVRSGQSGIGGVISPLRYSTGRDEDILKTLAAADVNIPDAPKAYRNMAINTAEQREFQTLAGTNLQRNVAQVMAEHPQFQEYDKETRQRVLERLVEASRRQAFGAMVERWSEPDIRRRLAEETERTKPMPVPR